MIYSPEHNRNYYVLKKGYSGATPIPPEKAEYFNESGYDIFFAIQLFRGERRLKQTLHTIRCYAVDLDNGTKEELMAIIKASPLEPSLIIETKNGYHVYFFLSHPIVSTTGNHQTILDRYKVIMENHLIPAFQLKDADGGIVYRNNKPVGADINAKDVCRLLRVPGFKHLKDPENPYLITVVHEKNSVRYSEQDLMHRFVRRALTRKEVELQLKNEIVQDAETGFKDVNYSLFWQQVVSIPVIEALTTLSGTEYVKNEVFTFSKNSDGTLQIEINGKASSCWVTDDNRIGSYDNGGPTIIQWLQWYGHTTGRVAKIVKELFTIKDNKVQTFDITKLLGYKKEVISYCGQLYVYSPQLHIWVVWPEVEVSNLIIKILEDNDIPPTSARIRDVYQLAVNYYNERGINLNKNKNVITFPNCVLDLDTLQTLQFSSEYYSTIAMDYNYNPDARCPLWEKFIAEVLPDEELQVLIQEVLGYCLTTDISHHVAFFLDGGGRNGKSTFMEILKSLVGDDNVSHTSLHNLSNRFGLQNMENKLVNYDPEISSDHLANTNVFKSIVGGDPIEIERKFKDSYTTRFFCKLVYAANELPAVKDRTKGFFSRLIILPFTEEFTEEKGNIDKKIAEKLKVELSGIFNWALAGLMRLRRNDGFYKAKRSLLRLEEYKKENNSLLMFLEDECVVTKLSSDTVTSKRLFERYVEWCKLNNMRAFSAKKMGGEVRKVGVEGHRTSTGIMYEGIILADDRMSEY